MNPTLVFGLYILLFILGGLPPFALFIGKLFIYSLIAEQTPLFFLLFFVFTALFMSFYLRFVLKLGRSFYSRQDFFYTRGPIGFYSGNLSVDTLSVFSALIGAFFLFWLCVGYLDSIGPIFKFLYWTVL
jgi:formate hydrogenlyase subunit 3/multisubunit Na+/H+ antiporter MnhD subunit